MVAIISSSHTLILLSAIWSLEEVSAFQSPASTRPSCTTITPTSLAAATATGTKKRTAPKEVESMFDEFASYFEKKLVDTLKYTTPQEVGKTALARIRDEDSGRQGRLYSSALDAGVGTGLAGPFLRKLVEGPMVGVDLSPKMAELAAELVVDDGEPPVVADRMRRVTETARLALGSDQPGGPPKRLYDGVFTGDLLDLSNSKFIDGYGLDVQRIPAQPFDLIVSADVLCYFGDMRQILQSFANMLEKGGDLIFTTETMKAGDYSWVMLQSERYAHCPHYVARMAAEAGLSKVSQVAFTPRMEAGEKVLGTLHTFTKQ